MASDRLLASDRVAEEGGVDTAASLRGRPGADTALAEEPTSLWGRLGGPLGLIGARLALIAVVLVIWQLVAADPNVEFLTSKPTAIVSQLVDWTKSGYIFSNTATTLEEAGLGFVFGAAAGIAIGVLLGLLPYLAKMLDPIVTALYSLPKIAVAPVFVLWFGIGLKMRIVFAAVLVFFFVFFNAYAGVRDTDPELADVMRVMGARRLDLLKKAVLPGALPLIFVGLKLAAPYALVGAVVGEIIASNDGLGFVLISTAGQYQTAGLFAALVALMIVAAIMNEILVRVERKMLRWRHAGR